MSQSQNLKGKKVAILVADGFEQSEFQKPRLALIEAGAQVTVVSPVEDQVTAWDGNANDFGDAFDVDLSLDKANADNFDALLLPGGVKNPDTLRGIPKAVKFVRAFFDAGKPVGAICHGPWMLVEADVVRGRRVTSYHTIQTDLKNAGAIWSDEAVVTDQGLVTSRQPDDIPAFNAKLIEEIAEGIHAGQHS